ncbi:MAG TPA: DUF1800 domain-containing protein [Oculatellaceae cyanobacterium]
MKRLYSLAAIASILTASTFGFASRAENNSDDDRVLHAINRLTFGPAPGDIERVKAMGVKAFIDQQLNPSSIPESPAVLAVESNTPSARSNVTELLRQVKNLQQLKKENKRERNASVNSAPSTAPANNADVEMQKEQAQTQAVAKFKELGKFYKQMNDGFITSRLARDVESPRQLQEVMTEFWFNHFNVCITKGLDHVLVGPYEDQAIRPYAMGKFRDLLGATCHHPAMLFYLDNWQNTAPESRGSQGKFKGLNENYARELMELHTLGVDGGYSQKDVIELARILTGLGMKGIALRQNMEPVGPYGAYFASNRHDFGEKVLLGHTISGKGEQEVEEALDMLARHPSTAHHISYQLAQYFVADDPPASLVNKMAARFTSTDGDIKEVLRTMFNSPEFWDPQYQSAKYKTPLRYAVSMLRATDSHPQKFDVVNQFLRLQGEPLFGCLTPDGYKNTKDAWLNPDGFLNRLNFATVIGSGNAKTLTSGPPEYRQLGATISGSKFSQKTVAVVAKAPEAMKSAVVLGSPEFMHY